jgi:glycosyltransferase involved in cell wall biosynthesis
LTAPGAFSVSSVVEVMISVLQGTAWYPPKHVGGTEVYLTGLVRELRAFNIDSRIIAPLWPESADGYELDSTVVRTYPVNPAPSRAELRSGAPHQGFERFRQLLAEERPDIYHQHSWSRGLGGAHLRAAREAGLKTVLTVHTPNNICLRGTMMRFGEEACDGRIDPPLCGACWSRERGAPKIVGRLLGGISPAISAVLEASMPPCRVATALSARALGERRKQEFSQAVADTDRIVAVCGWLFDALALNGVPAEKLILSRQGVDPDLADEAIRAASTESEPHNDQFRILYLGRWHPVKGVDVLVRAVKAISPEIPLTLSIHGVGGGVEERDYAAQIRRLAAGDPRIAIEPPVPRRRLALALTRASALAVPSLCLETGPLVVLEAKAAGLPIIGSRLGGIAELVSEPEEGVLVPPGDVGAWIKAIRRMASDHAQTTQFQKPRNRVRTMREAAEEMAALYASL